MNPNEIVIIKPTELGWKEIRAWIESQNKAGNPRELPMADKAGFIKGQF